MAGKLKLFSFPWKRINTFGSVCGCMCVVFSFTVFFQLFICKINATQLRNSSTLSN